MRLGNETITAKIAGAGRFEIFGNHFKRAPQNENRRRLPLRRDPVRGGGRRREGDDLPLQRLPDAVRLGLSHGGARAGVQAARGQPKIYVKTAESGNQRQQAFCAECGTPIYSGAVSGAPAYFLRVGSIRQRAAAAAEGRRSGAARRWAGPQELKDLPQAR